MARNVVSFYRDATNEWRWRAVDPGNHKEVGASTEGFDSYRNAYANAFDLMGKNVDYEKWSHEDTGDNAATLEVDDDGSETSE